MPALGAYSRNEQYVLIVNSQFALKTDAPNVQVRSVNIKRDVTRVWWDQTELNRVARSEHVDAIWCLLGFGSLRPPVPQVVFQRNAVYYCEGYLQSLPFAEQAQLALRRALQYSAMRASAAVVTPTDAMREMILKKHASLAGRLFYTLPHAFEASSLEMGEGLGGRLEEELRAVAHDVFTFVFVGHLQPYKRLDVLLEALLKVRTEMPERRVRVLLTIAREDWAQGYDAFVRTVDHLGLGDVVVILGKVSAGAIGSVYRAGQALLYTSVCESFGWPLLEAASLGLPVLAADVPVNREMAGEGALYFAPGQSSELAQQMCRLVLDAQLRSSISENGRRRFAAKALGWKAYVHRLLDLTARVTQT